MYRPNDRCQKLEPPTTAPSKVFSAYSRWVLGITKRSFTSLIGDRHHLVHFFDFQRSHLHLLQGRQIWFAVYMFAALVSAHGQHTLQGTLHRCGVTRGEQVGQILNRDVRSCLTSGISPFTPMLPALAAALMGDSGGTSPASADCAVAFGQGQSNFPFDSHFVNGAVAGSLHPLVRDAIDACLLNHLRVIRIEKDVELRLVQITVVLDACCLLIRSASYSKTPK